MQPNAAQRTRERQAGHILYQRRKLARVAPKPLRWPVIRKAAVWLFPYLDHSPGLYGSLTALLGCSVGSLKHWLHGRRNMPDRVRLILIATIENRLEAGAAVLAELKAAAPEPGSRRNNISSLNSAKARKAKAQDDATLDRP